MLYANAIMGNQKLESIILKSIDSNLIQKIIVKSRGSMV